MVKIDFRPMRATVRYDTAERALFLTEQAPGIVDVHQDVVGTASPYNFFGAVSGKLFRCLVPVRNPTLQISEEDPVKKVVQNLFEEAVHFI
jgi:acyl CoA:acetate/3-ketoacid CoA transferase